MLRFLLNGADTGGQVNFQGVNIGQGSTLALNVKNNGSSPVTVTSAQISNPMFASTPGTFSVPAGGTAPLNVTFTPTAVGPQQGALTLNLAGGGTATLNLAGTGVAVPIISVTPTNLDFGSVNVNQTSDLPVLIANKGLAALAVQSLSITGAGYSLVNAPTTPFVVSSTAKQIVVRFAPTSAGAAQKGTLTILSNDPAFPVVTVNLTGNSVATGSSIDIVVDGGFFGQVTGFPSGAASAWFVNRLTPPSYPATLRSVTIAFLDDPAALPAGAGITIVTAANSSGSTSISSASFTQMAATIKAVDQFNTYAVTPVTITSGDFLVGYAAPNPPGFFPAVLDIDSGSKMRSYMGTSSTNLTLLDSLIPGGGNLGIRATVDLGTSAAGSLQFSSPAIDASGTLNFTQPGSAQVSANNVGGAMVTVNSIQSSNPAFSAIPQSFSVAPGGSQAIAVVLSASGAQQGTLTFNLAGGGTATLKVASSPAQSASISVSPATLDFGSVPVSTTKDLPLQISNTGTAPLNVSAITPSNARFSVVSGLPPTIGPGSAYPVTIRFSPATSGSQSGTITIASNDPAHPTVTVNVQGTGGAPNAPAISVSPASLDFGSVTLGQFKELTLQVSNIGTATLNVTSLGGSSGQFTKQSGNLPGTIAPGGSVNMTIRFTPASAGPASGTITISSNDPARPTVVVNVSGNASAAVAGTCPASNGTGTYTLSSISVTRVYKAGGAGAQQPPPGTVTVPASTCSFNLGWNFKWPDPNTGPNRNIGTSTVSLTQVPLAVTPGTTVTVAASMVGHWDATGYGVERAHTISLDGAAGSNSKSVVGDPSSVQDLSFTTSGSTVVPAASGNQVVLTLNAAFFFGASWQTSDADTGSSMQIRLIYTHN